MTNVTLMDAITEQLQAGIQSSALGSGFLHDILGRIQSGIQRRNQGIVAIANSVFRRRHGRTIFANAATLTELSPSRAGAFCAVTSRKQQVIWTGRPGARLDGPTLTIGLNLPHRHWEG